MSDADRGRARPSGAGSREVPTIAATAGVVLCGIQLLLPALPEIGRAFALSASQIGLVTLVYLAASFVAALPGGMLADLIGRRHAVVGALVLFAVASLVAGLTGHFGVFLAARVVQGACFGVIQPTTIAMAGEAVGPRGQVPAQAQRYFGVAIGDAAWPLVGAGALLLAGWRSVVLLQVVTAVAAVAVAAAVPERHTARSTRGRGPAYLGGLQRSLREPVVAVLAVAGVVRFAAKFGFLTYLPVLMATAGDEGIVAALSLSVGSAGGAVAGMVLGRLTVRWRPSVALRLAVVAAAVALVGLAWSGPLVVMALFAVVVGIADGVNGVLQNAFLSVLTRDRDRGGVIAAVGTVRNVGKALGPAVVAALLVAADLRVALSVLALVVAASVITLGGLSQHDRKVSAAG